MSWWNLRMASFDVETTSADPETARIVSAAVVLCSGGQETVCRDWLIAPEEEIPQEAIDVHGITNERARAEGMPPAAALAEMLYMIAERAQAGPLVVFNAPFDLTIADREARRYGLKPIQDRGQLLVVDPFVIDKQLHRYRKGSRKLDAMCEWYRVELESAHEAYSDALATARLAFRMCAQGRIIRRVRDQREEEERRQLEAEWEGVRGDLELLHEAQESWRRVEQRRFREYRKEKGEDYENIREDWPLIPEGKYNDG